MSTSTLTERYVHDVVRRLPADQRQDVAVELRGTIADTIEGRQADDEQPDDEERAEHTVLAEVNQDWTTPDEVYTGAAVIVVILAVVGIVGRFRQVSARTT